MADFMVPGIISKVVFPVAITCRFKHSCSASICWVLLCSGTALVLDMQQGVGALVWWCQHKSKGKKSALLEVSTWYTLVQMREWSALLRRVRWGYYYMIISFKTLILCFVDHLWITPRGVFVFHLPLWYRPTEVWALSNICWESTLGSDI